MTEQEWTTATDARPMLRYIKDRVSVRKLRLASVACCSRVALLPRYRVCRSGVALAERYADGEVSDSERIEASQSLGNVQEFGHTLMQANYWQDRTTCLACLAVYESLASNERLRHDGGATVAYRATGAATHQAIKTAKTAGLIGRDRWIAGELSAKEEARIQSNFIRDIFGNPFQPVVFDPSWRSEAAVALARTIYITRDFSLLPVLADCLEDAGCNHPDVLAHSRSPGPHTRGCWVVDLVLNNE